MPKCFPRLASAVDVYGICFFYRVWKHMCLWSRDDWRYIFTSATDPDPETGWGTVQTSSLSLSFSPIEGWEFSCFVCFFATVAEHDGGFDITISRMYYIGHLPRTRALGLSQLPDSTPCSLLHPHTDTHDSVTYPDTSFSQQFILAPTMPDG